MNFHASPLADVWLIELNPIADQRGSFVRAWSTDVLAEKGLNTHWIQENISFNHQAGTLRGLHFQRPPHAEIKLVRCSQGGIWDVVVDLRSSSPTYGQWQAFELHAERPAVLYIPAGCAHGFQTLTPGAEVTYHMSQAYQPEAAAGIFWQDSSLAIPWPLPVTQISERDQHLPSWEELDNPWS